MPKVKLDFKSIETHWTGGSVHDIVQAGIDLAKEHNCEVIVDIQGRKVKCHDDSRVESFSKDYHSRKFFEDDSKEPYVCR